MPLTLSVGLSRKVGQPNYGSLGASCGVQVELDPNLLRDDPEALQERVHDAFLACRKAVDEELARGRHAALAPGGPLPIGRPCALHRSRRRRRSGPTRRWRRRPQAPGHPCIGRPVRSRPRRPGRRAASTADGPEPLSAVEAARLIEDLQSPGGAHPARERPAWPAQ